MLAVRAPISLARGVRALPCPPLAARARARAAPAAPAPKKRAGLPPRPPRPPAPARRALTTAHASAGDGEGGEANTTLQLVAGALGTPAALLVCYSAYLLATTGDGLPPGPGGAYGAAEGVSYLAVLGLVGWSAATKARTGSGLPAGPAGLLGAAEGLSYLALLAAIGAFGYTAATGAGIPGPFGR